MNEYHTFVAAASTAAYMEAVTPYVNVYELKSEDESLTTAIAFGISILGPYTDEKPVRLMVVSPLEVAASLVAAIRFNVDHNNLLTAFDAAVDRHDAMWRDIYKNENQ